MLDNQKTDNFVESQAGLFVPLSHSHWDSGGLILPFVGGDAGRVVTHCLSKDKSRETGDRRNSGIYCMSEQGSVFGLWANVGLSLTHQQDHCLLCGETGGVPFMLSFPWDVEVVF